jgi:hypothetical protein
MAAAPVHVDGVAERQERVARQAVDDGPGLDVEELHAPELAPADLAPDGLEQLALGIGVVGQLPPELGRAVERSAGHRHATRLDERMFAVERWGPQVPPAQARRRSPGRAR